MFPVRGWSLPASALKAQSALPPSKILKEANPKSQSNGFVREPDKKSKKRKRDHGRSIGVEVTKENVAELWEKHISGTPSGRPIGQKEANGDRMKSKKGRQKDEQAGSDISGHTVDHGRDSVQVEKLAAAAVNAKQEKEKRKKGLEHEIDETSLVKYNEEQVNNSASPNRVDNSKLDKRRRKKARLEDGDPASAEAVVKQDHVFESSDPDGSDHIAIQATSSSESVAKPIPNTTLDATKGTEQLSAKEANKAKFERRKAAKEAKRQQRVLLQSEGDAPPDRSVQPATVEAAPKAPMKALAKKTPQPAVPEAIPKAPSKTLKKDKNPQVNKDTSSITAGPSSKPITHPEPKIDSLTPLQKIMRDKLTSARFRHLNQTLYTSPSNSTLTLFSETPTLFDDYHAGFREQVATWPENPVDKFAADIKLRGRVRIESQKGAWRKEKRCKSDGKGDGKGDGKAKANETTTASETGAAEPLPRTRGACTIADLGCGDAVLARSLQRDIRPLNLKILSYDLAKGTSGGKKFIKIADIANLPLEDGSVDLAIFCLALMGTNWVNFIDEAARVVRWKGELWVAEIKSRFGRVGRGKKETGDGKAKGKGKKVSKEERQREHEEVVVEEIDGGKGAQETDVSAFVEVLRKRGFLVKGEAEMDNKMFVSMRFAKAGLASRGKVEQVEAKGAVKRMFIDEEKVEGDEGKVLKPCVYKIR